LTRCAGRHQPFEAAGPDPVTLPPVDGRTTRSHPRIGRPHDGVEPTDPGARTADIRARGITATLTAAMQALQP